METTFLLGRGIFAVYFLIAAWNHFSKAGYLAGYAQSKKVPAPKAAVIGSGILLLIGGLSILLGLWPAVGIFALILFLVPVSFMMHAYWNETDPQRRASEVVNFGKNMALVGALLMMLALPYPWPLSF